MATLDSIYANTTLEQVRVTSNTSVIIVPGDTNTYYYDTDSSTFIGTNNTVSFSDTNILILKSGVTDGIDESVIGVTVDYSPYIDRLTSALESLANHLDVAANTATVGTTIASIDSSISSIDISASNIDTSIGSIDTSVSNIDTNIGSIETSLDYTANNSFANNSVAEANKIYTELKTKNDRKKITRLILDYVPFTPNTSIDTEYGLNAEDIPDTAVEKTNNVDEILFLEGEIMNGSTGQGVVTSSYPVDYEKLIQYKEVFLNGSIDDFSEDNYEITETNFNSNFFVVDLVNASGTFTIGESVTGNISGYSSTIRSVFEVEGSATYQIENATNGSGADSDPLNTKQQRALIISALKQSNSLEELIQEITNPTALPGG